MTTRAGNLTKMHGITFGALLTAFTAATFLIMSRGADPGDGHSVRVLQTTLGTMAGPLTGAIARGFQPCCLDFSLRVMAFCGPVLLLCVLLQSAGSHGGRMARAVRLGLWVAGWLAWFLGGILSFAHALS